MPPKILIMKARKFRFLTERCSKKTQHHNNTTPHHHQKKTNTTHTHHPEIRESLGFLETFFWCKGIRKGLFRNNAFPLFCPENYLSLSTLRFFLGQGYHVHRPFGDMQFLIPDPDSYSLRSKTSRFYKGLNCLIFIFFVRNHDFKPFPLLKNLISPTAFSLNIGSARILFGREPQFEAFFVFFFTNPDIPSPASFFIIKLTYRDPICWHWGVSPLVPFATQS